MSKDIKKSKKRRLKTSIIVSLLLIIVVLIMIYCISDILGSLTKEEKEVEVLESIEEYGYELNENDSPYFKKLFTKLKNELESEDVDEEAYAKLVSQLFVTDFYSLEYVINKNDVGGTQFVYKDYQGDFVKYAKTSVYDTVENNVYGKRNQVLPNVKNVEIENIEQGTYQSDVGFSDDEAYYIDVLVTYDEDMDYPSNCSLIIAHSNDKLEIVEMQS